MDNKMVDIMLHIDEEIDSQEREILRDTLLHTDGVMAADTHDTRPHLLIIEYNPDVIGSSEFIHIAQRSGLHAQLIGM